MGWPAIRSRWPAPCTSSSRRRQRRRCLPRGEAQLFRVVAAVVLGQDLADLARRVGDGAMADLAAGERKLGDGHGEAAGG